MSVGRAFHTCGPTTKMALSAKCSWVHLTTKLHHSLDRSRLYSRRSKSCTVWGTLGWYFVRCRTLVCRVWNEFGLTLEASGAVSEEVAHVFEEVRHRVLSRATASCARCRRWSVDCELQINRLLTVVQHSSHDRISTCISVYSVSCRVSSSLVHSD